MNKEILLMIFTQNTESEVVKHNIAKTIGTERAMNVYKSLSKHTYQVINEIESDKAVFYSNKIENDDIWPTDSYSKFLKEGKDKNTQISNAFKLSFEKNYQKVILIECDCIDLNKEVVRLAIEELNEYEIVIGPTKGGGFYLIGMKKPLTNIFNNIHFDTENVFLDILIEIKSHDLKYKLLETLTDVTKEEDFFELRDQLNNI